MRDFVRRSRLTLVAAERPGHDYDAETPTLC
jgi:hypothetical protein